MIFNLFNAWRLQPDRASIHDGCWLMLMLLVCEAVNYPRERDETELMEFLGNFSFNAECFSDFFLLLLRVKSSRMLHQSDEKFQRAERDERCATCVVSVWWTAKRNGGVLEARIYLVPGARQSSSTKNPFFSQKFFFPMRNDKTKLNIKRP